MKSRLIPYIICLLQTANLLGQGTVNFSNAGDGRVTNGLTHQPLPVGTNYVVHLFYAPVSTPSEQLEGSMISLLPATSVRPVPGAFIGGSRTTPATTPGGAPAGLLSSSRLGRLAYRTQTSNFKKNRSTAPYLIIAK